jgi:hypothetical protein
LYGLGQGSTCGPLFWLLCYWIIVKSLDPRITPAKFYSVCKEVIFEVTGVSFVDDTSLLVISDYILDPTLYAQRGGAFGSTINNSDSTLGMVAFQYWQRPSIYKNHTSTW